MILFLLANYAISISMVWIMFRVTQPNELYFFVSLSIFLFFIYPAAPNNMQTSKEEAFWPMLFISPTAVRDVLIAKSIAVYSLMAPIILLVGCSILSFIGLDGGRIFLTLFMGLLVGSVSVWFGAIETMMRLTGRSFWERFKVSALSFVGSIIIFSVIYFVKELYLMSFLLWVSIAVLSYSISIWWSLSFCIKGLSKNVKI